MNRLAQKMVVFVAAVIAPFVVAGQSPTPKFEVASIRAIKDCDLGRGGRFEPQMKGGPASKQAPASPDRLNICGPVMLLINTAYVVSSAKGGQDGSGSRLVADTPIEGGPSWVRTDNYMIVAKADHAVSRDVVDGPMLRALLIDRFKLKIRRESRVGPAYALTIAGGGPRLRKSTCTPPAFGPDAGSAPAGMKTCALDGAIRKGTELAVDRYAKSLAEFSLTLGLDRPVVDRTGVKGIFDFHIEFVPDDTTPLFQARIQQLPDDAPATGGTPAGGASIFTALREQLGLKLEPVKAPRDFLVIDSIARPSED
jgi:uncharacterized protein (TIGR03435 family)